MTETAADNILEEFPRDDELADIDFSSLLEFPGMNNPAFSNVPAGEKYVAFYLDEKLYGINSKSVSEVTTSLPVTPLPNVPDWLLGIANLRGDLITVIDLRKLWKKNTPTPLKTRLIVFHSEKNDCSIAFVVDRLNEIVTLADKDIRFSAEDFTDSFPTFFGKADFRSQHLYLLDVEKILSTLRIEESKPVRI